jgi:exonuclease SbcC
VIESLTLKNFQSHAESSLEFSSGVNVILGDTDSGKTSILRAINWVVTNRPRGSSFIRKGKKSCSVLVQTKTGSVERQKKSSFNGYKIKTLESEGAFTEVGTSVPQEVMPVICLGEINTQSQLSSHFLVGMSAGNISKSLSELLGFEFADGLASLVKSGSTQVSKDVSRLSEETSSLDLKLNVLKRKLEAKDKVEESKKIFNTLNEIAVNSSTLEMLLSTYKDANSKLKRANLILSKLGLVDSILTKFDNLNSSFIAHSNYEVLLNKLKKSNFYLESNKVRLYSFVDIDEVPEKISELDSFVFQAKDLLKSVQALKSHSLSVLSVRKDSEKANDAFDEGLKVFEAAVDELDHCKECLREFTENDRAIAKGIGQ